MSLALGVLGILGCPVQTFLHTYWVESPLVREVSLEASARAESQYYQPWKASMTTEVQGVLGEWDTTKVVVGGQVGVKTGGLCWQGSAGVEGQDVLWTQFFVTWSLWEGGEDSQGRAKHLERESLGVRAAAEALEGAVAALRAYFYWENAAERVEFLESLLTEERGLRKDLLPEETDREVLLRRNIRRAEVESALLQARADKSEAQISLWYYLPGYPLSAPGPVPPEWLKPPARAPYYQAPAFRQTLLEREKVEAYHRALAGEKGPQLAFKVNRTVTNAFSAKPGELRNLIAATATPWSWKVEFSLGTWTEPGTLELARVQQDQSLRSLEREESLAWQSYLAAAESLKSLEILETEQVALLEIQKGRWELGLSDSEVLRDTKRVLGGLILEKRRLERELAWKGLDYQARFWGRVEGGTLE